MRPLSNQSARTFFPHGVAAEAVSGTEKATTALASRAPIARSALRVPCVFDD